MVSVKKRQMLMNLIIHLTINVYIVRLLRQCVTAIHLDFSDTNFVNQFNDKVTEEFVFGIIVILHATEYIYNVMLMILQQ